MESEFRIEEMAAQPISAIRLTTSQEAVGEALGEALPEVWGVLESQGITPAGPPIVRYYSFDNDTLELDAGMPTVEPAPAHGRVQPAMLPAGRAAVGDHIGPYDTLRETYAALEAWMSGEGLTPREGPWEVYLTDPGEVPDPAQWRTQIVWPVA